MPAAITACCTDICSSPGQLAVEWLSWEPRVIAVDETDSVTLTVVVEGNPTAVKIALLGGGSVSLDAVGNSTYRVTLSAAPIRATAVSIAP